MALKLVREQLTLVYGLRLFTGRASEGAAHLHVPVPRPDGGQDEMALHTMSGTRAEIREQLLQSIDAFFELVDPTPGGTPGGP
ncbi:MAG: allantoinase [Myxococcales bacterium]|nr:allantoinase [Myxococcales bacterium]